MRANYKVPPIITAIAIAAGLFASAVTGDEARASDRTACAKEISAEVAPERG